MASGHQHLNIQKKTKFQKNVERFTFAGRFTCYTDDGCIKMIKCFVFHYSSANFRSNTCSMEIQKNKMK